MELYVAQIQKEYFQIFDVEYHKDGIYNGTGGSTSPCLAISP